jgi:hypothetical protein
MPVDAPFSDEMKAGKIAPYVLDLLAQWMAKIEDRKP